MNYTYHSENRLQHCISVTINSLFSGSAPIYWDGAHTCLQPAAREWLETNVGEEDIEWSETGRFVSFRIKDHAMLFKLTFA